MLLEFKIYTISFRTIRLQHVAGDFIFRQKPVRFGA